MADGFPVQQDLEARYRSVRQKTERLAAPLAAKDQAAQSMADASPTKWRLAHTTWFFETFLLDRPGYQPFDQRNRLLFNSYYESIGSPHPRSSRGLLTRSTLQEVLDYRTQIDAAMIDFLCEMYNRLQPVMELGLNHEQQHQELILMDMSFPSPYWRRRVGAPLTEASRRLAFAAPAPPTHTHQRGTGTSTAHPC